MKQNSITGRHIGKSKNKEARLRWPLLPASLLAKANEYFHGKSQSKGNPQAGDQKWIGLDSSKEETPTDTMTI
jgi:hypothetical protein